MDKDHAWGVRVHARHAGGHAHLRTHTRAHKGAHNDCPHCAPGFNTPVVVDGEEVKVAASTQMGGGGGGEGWQCAGRWAGRGRG